MDVQPANQNLNTLFGTETYYIDFYQRQYKWNKVPVERLLDDIFYKFNEEFLKYKDSDIELKKIIESYSWYYLNTYVTNKIEGKTFVVDGQQRLTTLSLILIKLVHLAELHESKLKSWIEGKVAGTSGFEKEFWMNHEDHISTLNALLENKIKVDEIDTSAGITSENLVANFKVIGKYLDKQLKDKPKFESFVFYAMQRLVLIKLHVEQTDVPMIFEVINDRGVKLKPYEILKGKLLGQINKNELYELKLNTIWDTQVDGLNAIQEDKIDDFFIYYLRAKYSDTTGEADKIGKNYHRFMFSADFQQYLNVNHNPKVVKDFLQNEFQYYTELHRKLLNYYKEPTKGFEHVYYNNLNTMDSQFLLVHSACIINDPEESEKIKTIAYEVDRLFSLLQLQQSYDSNDFNVKIYAVSKSIRNQPVEIIRSVFDKALLELLEKARGAEVEQVISYSFFKDTGISMPKRFKRYFFARIEKFLAENTNFNMKKNLYDLVANTGSRNGFHIEHILAKNTENFELFGKDEELFDKERNRLGALLLLKGKDNQKSSNEIYAKKLKSYSNTLYWNETLLADTYVTKADFQDMMKKHNLEFRSMESFGIQEVEERHRLLFNIASIIWK